MRKICFAFAALAMAALVSCQNNELGDGIYVPEKGEVLFHLASSGKATKAADAADVVQGVTIPVGDTGFSLDETITRLDEVAYAPDTKGIPGFKENFNDLYGGFNASVYQVEGTTATEYESDGRFEIANTEGLVYKRKYGNDLLDAGSLYFFLNAYYADKSLAGVTNLQGHPVAEGTTYKAGDISFHYSSADLGTAASQSDLLFTSRKVTSDEYGVLTDKGQGVPVLFHHALTGIKFRVGNDNTGSTKTIITRVEISGLYDSGDCVISPISENNYSDNKTNYSSAAAVKWSNYDMALGSFSQSFANPTYTPASGASNSDGTVNFTSGEDNTFGDSWYAAGKDENNPSNMNNLNYDDGSLTFWLIPQTITSNVKLKVYFRVKTPDTPNGTEIIHEINNFGTVLNGVKWQAGELRTYTLNPLDVDVEIFDTMSGKSKTNLHVTNTGNVSEYVRMLVIGNWYGWESEADMNAGKEPEILVGYKTDGSGGENDNDMADPWYREDPQFGQYFDNTFTNGKVQAANGNKWLRGTTGFYYPDPIGPGVTMNAASEALFKSYVWPEDVPFPTIYIPDPNSNIRKPAVGVHLIMEVAVQAISSKDSDGNDYEDCWAAWTAAIFPNGGGEIAPK